jgi:hypothetical protein
VNGGPKKDNDVELLASELSMNLKQPSLYEQGLSHPSSRLLSTEAEPIQNLHQHHLVLQPFGTTDRG